MTYYELLEQWEEAKKNLRGWQAEERRLRDMVVQGAFGKELKEGTNKFALADGRVVKATGKINRTIDAAALQALNPRLLAVGVPVDELVRYKPELKVGPYRKLTGEGAKLFATVVTEKPGTPEIQIV